MEYELLQGGVADGSLVGSFTESDAEVRREGDADDELMGRNLELRESLRVAVEDLGSSIL